jgi:alpha-tubulin suppressor-like RCC1 family protein
VDVSDAYDLGVRSHACAVLSTGHVECWGGENLEGELGNGKRQEGHLVETPHAVSGISNATSVSAGSNASCAVLATGGVDCWGENHYESEGTGGALGNGEEKGPEQCQTLPVIYCSVVPVAVVGITNATEVSVGDGFACARLATGHVVCWGREAMLGDGIENSSDEPVEVSGLTSASTIATGVNEACAVLTEGSIECWGDNDWGQVNTHPEEPRFVLTPARVPGFGE